MNETCNQEVTIERPISKCVVSVVPIAALALPALAIAPFAGAQEDDWLPPQLGSYQVGTTYPLG